MRHWYRECVALSLCGRSKRRWYFCFNLSAVSGYHGSTGSFYGICGWRASRKSPVKAYQELEKPGSKWHLHGYVALLGNYVLMMFYTTVAGWMLYYFYSFATGAFSGLHTEGCPGNVWGDAGQPGP